MADPAGDPPCHALAEVADQQRHHPTIQAGKWRARLVRWQGPDAGWTVDTRRGRQGCGLPLPLLLPLPAARPLHARWVAVFLRFAGSPAAGCGGCSGPLPNLQDAGGRSKSELQRSRPPSRRAASGHGPEVSLQRQHQTSVRRRGPRINSRRGAAALDRMLGHKAENGLMARVIRGCSQVPPRWNHPSTIPPSETIAQARASYWMHHFKPSTLRLGGWKRRR